MSAPSVSRRSDELAGVIQPVTVVSLASLAFAAVSTVLMLQSMRVFVSYLVFVIDQSQRTTLAGIAAGVFLASGLGWLLIKFVGPVLAVVTSSVVLSIARLALQFWAAPEARLWLGAAAVVAWGWLAYGLLVSRRDSFALGLGFGLALDLGIRVSFRTVDTPWIPSIASNLVTAALVGLMLGSLSYIQIPELARGWHRRSAISLVAIGPAIAFYFLALGNLGLVQSRLGLDFPGAAVVLTFGMAIGILGAALRWSGEIAVLASSEWRVAWRITLAVAVLAGFWWFWLDRPFSVVGFILCSAASIMLLTETLLDEPITGGDRTPLLPAILFTVGLLLEMGLLFAYYTRSGSPTLLGGVIVVFVLSALAGATNPLARSIERGFPSVVAAGVLGGLLLLVSGWQVWSWSDAAAVDAIGPNITVMTYNIQSGFSANNRFDLDRIAQVIEQQQPDVVVLQEVSRGWLVTSSVDEVLWLSHRLNMNYAFGPNSDDGLWGNLVLSRAPITSVEKVQYTETQNLKRSVLQVQITTQAGDIWVLATHLDDPRNAGAVRLAQANQLVNVWSHHSPALLMGDMNADSGDPVIQTFRAAGLIDLGQNLGPDQTTSSDGRRIDYIFSTPDIGLSDIRALNVWTSDHRPVVARVTIFPAQSHAPEIQVSGSENLHGVQDSPVTPYGHSVSSSGQIGRRT